MDKLISELQKISTDFQQSFGSLSDKQINWKPAAESWSVGQCVEHLIKSNEMLYDVIGKIADGTKQNSFLENWSPLSGFFGGFLIRSLKSDSKKFKAPTQAIVPPSEIDPHIIEIFEAHQTEVIEKIRSTENADWKKTIVTSPFLQIITYSLKDAYAAMVEHEKRHFRQAKRAVETDGFPK